jgi:conjugal transfer ATP-binding protein TraC
MSAVLLEEERGATREQIERQGARESLSEYLPYLAYDEETSRYFLFDGAEQPHNVGYMWECVPLTFASDKEMDKIAGLLRQRFPERTVIQFIMYPDTYIDPILRRYRMMKTRKDELSQAAAEHFSEFLSESREGLENMSGIPVRNYRLFCTVKSPHPEGLPEELLALFEETLKQVGLTPTRVRVGWFLEFMRRLINGRVPQEAQTHSPERYLRRQIIESNTVIRKHKDVLQIGDQWAGCVTPMVLPTNGEVVSLSMNQIVGGFAGYTEDSSQMNHRFLWTTSIFFQSTPASIRRKIGIMQAQKAGGGLAKRLHARNIEGNMVADELEVHPYCNVITAMWIFGDSKDDVDAGVARAINLWERQKFMMQRDNAVLMPLFISSLPFGLYLQGKNIEVMRRDFEVSVLAAAHFAPIQADFGGYMSPVFLTVGRKGQLQSIDVYDPLANNHNYLVCAGSGAGKSFTTNTIVQNYYGAGAKIRIIDIGYSYRKQCMLAKGRYVDVGAEADKLVLNPFHSVAKDTEDSKGDEIMIANILLTMTYSSTGTTALNETHWSLMKDAVRFAIKQDGGQMGVDHVYRFLKTFPKFAEADSWQGAAPTAHEMAFNIRDYISTGKHGRMFNGKSTLDLSSDEFVVLELERIMNDPELFQVIAMQVINAITMDLYLSNRKDKRFMLFDEAWKYFGEAPMIAKIIQEGYRRARKYGGSTGIVTQSPMDLKAFGPAGVVVRSNSAYKFFLESNDYAEAVKEQILDYDGLLLELALSVRNQKPRYSEILFDTPRGAGVGRLIVDRWTYWLNTSSATEVAMFDDLIRAGFSPRAAIDKLAQS